MSLSHRFFNNILVIDLEGADGPLIEGDVEKFIDSAVALVDTAKNVIGLDMAKKKYLNSWGLGQLIKVKDFLSDRGIELYLINLTQRVSALLSMVGVEEFFKVVSSENEIK